jgi:asparagine synthetase B (glutamine-hydrolysing)
MFLFCSDLTKVDLRGLYRLVGTANQWKAERVGDAGIVWLQTPFTFVGTNGGEFMISLQRPEDPEPICQLRWFRSSRELLVTRRWSGELSIHIAQNLQRVIVTSHTRVAAMACGGCPAEMKRLAPGHTLRVRLRRPEQGQSARGRSSQATFGMTYAQTLAGVRREMYSSVSKLPNRFALLLSGGLDSSIIAGVARDIGKNVVPYVFSLKRPIVRQTRQESDLVCACIVAKHLGLRCREIMLDAAKLVENVPLAILLAETPRGTIVDPSTGLIEVARRISKDGFSSVAIGEAADDLFGSFTFALRYMRGQGLRRYYRKELDVGLPDEMAVLQRVFEPWGISLLDPFWTRRFKNIGYNIPLSFRLDPRRLMKRVLRDAFSDMLPVEILLRPKVITRDGTQIRYALEERFGVSRERYRPMFKRMFTEGRTWPKNLPQPKISRR